MIIGSKKKIDKIKIIDESRSTKLKTSPLKRKRLLINKRAEQNRIN